MSLCRFLFTVSDILLAASVRPFVFSIPKKCTWKIRCFRRLCVKAVHSARTKLQKPWNPETKALLQICSPSPQLVLIEGK